MHRSLLVMIVAFLVLCAGLVPAHANCAVGGCWPLGDGRWQCRSDCQILACERQDLGGHWRTHCRWRCQCPPPPTQWSRLPSPSPPLPNEWRQVGIFFTRDVPRALADVLRFAFSPAGLALAALPLVLWWVPILTRRLKKPPQLTIYPPAGGRALTPYNVVSGAERLFDHFHGQLVGTPEPQRTQRATQLAIDAIRQQNGI